MRSRLPVAFIAATVTCQQYCPSISFKDPAFPSGVNSTTSPESIESISSLPISTNSSIPNTFFLPSNNSEVVTLAYPGAFSTGVFTNRTNCPHLQSGLSLWHDPATWGGSLPDMSASSSIILPSNSKVLVSSCSIPSNVSLGILTIPENTTLVFADAPISITVQGILNYGKLQIGSSTCRFQSRINITLVGDRPDGSNPEVLTSVGPQVKGIATSSGTIDIHGALYHPTWTRLAATAKAGSSWLFLQEWVNWEVNQSIVVTTSTFKDSRDYHENEIRSIKAIFKISRPPLMAIQLNETLKYSHYGGKEYQTEIALLSRRIIIQGSASDSEPVDIQPVKCLQSKQNYFESYPCGNTSLTGYGGHVHVTGTGAVGRFSGIQFYRMGQTNYLGRYPVHFHLLGLEGNKSFVQDSSIWRSFYRCVAIHNGYGVTVSRNVAHDAIGHCYYLEDGTEERNVLEYNYGSLVHFFGSNPPASNIGTSGQLLLTYNQSASLLLPADIAASVFYITNQYNTIVGNAASGGWSGFAFPTLSTAVGLARDTLLNPSSLPTLLFDGNTAHSSGYYWNQAGCIYSGGVLSYDPLNADYLLYNPGRGGSKSGLSNFTNIKVWMCNVGVLHWGSNIRFSKIETHDSLRAVTVFGTVGLKECLFNCRSNNTLTLTGNSYDQMLYTYPYAEFQWYDVGQTHIVANTTFRNCVTGKYSYSTASTWQFLTHSDQFVPDAMQATIGIIYQNTDYDKRISRNVDNMLTRNTTSGRLQNWDDLDGSASGTGVPTIMGSSTANDWYKMDNFCIKQSSWQLWLCNKTNAVTGRNRSVGSIYMAFDPVLQSTASAGITYCTNGDGLPCPSIGKVMHVGWNKKLEAGLDITATTKVTGPLNGFGWFFNFSYGTPNTITLNQIQMNYSDTFVLVYQYPVGTTVNISATALSCKWWLGLCLRDWNFRPGNSVQSVFDSIAQKVGDVYFFNATTGHLYVPISQQRYSALGNKKVWQIGPFNDTLPNDLASNTFSFEGATINARTNSYSYSIKIKAICPNSTLSSDGLYCRLSSVIMPASPCAYGQDAYDSCNPAPVLTTTKSVQASTATLASSSVSRLSATTSVLDNSFGNENPPFSGISASTTISASPTTSVQGNSSDNSNSNPYSSHLIPTSSADPSYVDFGDRLLMLLTVSFLFF